MIAVSKSMAQERSSMTGKPLFIQAPAGMTHILAVHATARRFPSLVNP